MRRDSHRPALRSPRGRRPAASSRRRRCARFRHAHQQVRAAAIRALAGHHGGCSVKSQCSDRPASSTTRRNVISPQRPRTSGRRSAVDRLRVSRCRSSCSFDEAFDLAGESCRRFERCSRTMLCACSSCLRSAFLMGSSSCAIASFALLERGLRGVLVASEDLARQLEEGFAVGVEREARGAFDGGTYLRLALRQQLGIADALLLVRGDACARGFELAAQRFRAPRRAQSADQIADDRGRDARPASR